MTGIYALLPLAVLSSGVQTSATLPPASLRRLCQLGLLGKQSTILSFKMDPNQDWNGKNVRKYVNPYYTVYIGIRSGNILQINPNMRNNFFLEFSSDRERILPATLKAPEKELLIKVLTIFGSTYDEFIAPQPKVYMMRSNEFEPQSLIRYDGVRISFNIYTKIFNDSSTIETDKFYGINILTRTLSYYRVSVSEFIEQSVERSSEQAKSVALKFLYDNKIKVPIQSLSARMSSEMDVRATIAHEGDGALILTKHWIVTVKSASSKVDGKEVIVAAGNLKEEDPPRISIPFYI